MHLASPLFVHWRARPAALEAALPAGVALDRFEGRALVTLVALEARGPMPKLGSSLGQGRAGRYRQVSLRTYARGERGPGVVLLDTAVDRRLTALSARLLGMPYRVARPIELTVGDEVSLITPDLRLSGRTVCAGPALAAPGTLEQFALERSWIYGRLPGGLGYGVRIAHAPWHIRAVALDEVVLTGALPALAGADGPVAAELGDEQNVALVELAALRAPSEPWDWRQVEAPI
jgi:uncharacterized protein YqjF (DUF2071 family)